MVGIAYTMQSCHVHFAIVSSQNLSQDYDILILEKSEAYMVIRLNGNNVDPHTLKKTTNGIHYLIGYPRINWFYVDWRCFFSWHCFEGWYDALSDINLPQMYLMLPLTYDLSRTHHQVRTKMEHGWRGYDGAMMEWHKSIKIEMKITTTRWGTRRLDWYDHD